jgi:hypothetical protein
MSRQTIELLASEMDEAWQILCRWVDDLTDEEFFWEPVPGCWTVHPDESGRWVLDCVVGDVDPLPFTTIAWRLIHIATCKVMYHEYAFGPGEQTWEELEIPHTIVDTVNLLQTGHDLLRRALDELNDGDLEEMRLTNWGELWPTWRIFWVMINHDLQHGAEIGCLRHLYRSLEHKEGKA